MCSATFMHFRELGTKPNEHEACMLYYEARLKDRASPLRYITPMYLYGQGVSIDTLMAETSMHVTDVTKGARATKK